MYAAAIAKQNGEGGGGDYPKYPNFKFNDIGDKVMGTVAKVGKPFEKTNEYKGEVRTVVVQCIELDNATIIRQAEEGEEPKKETFPKLNIWIQKTGEKAAIGLELMRLELSEIPVGGVFGIKWTGLGQAVGDGARPHKFKVQIVPSE